MKKSIYKKLLSAVLSLTLAGSAAAVLPAFVPESGIEVNAAETGWYGFEEVGGEYGHFEYVVNNNEIKITKYEGSGGNITIPSDIDGKKVTSIGSSAFSGCTSLTSIMISYNVTSIGSSAFSGCTSLTSIMISYNVTSIGNLAFSGCTSLTNITVDSGNKYYSSKDGVLYNKSKTGLVCCPGGKKSVTIPSGVTSIEWGAFYSCKSLTSITIPSSVTSIGNVAFYYCISLTSITIPSSVTSIGNNVFFGIINLKTIYGAKGSYAETYAKEKGISFVANEVAPTSVSLDRTELIVYKNYTKKLTATVYPSNATYKTVTWSTGNSSVATVSGGTVTGKGYGTTTITAKTCNGKTASCKVTVIVEETGVKLGSSSIEIEKGKSRTLSATVQPTNAYFKDIIWTSSDTSVATVSENGVITGKNTGTTTITAETHNHNKTTCKVTVTPRVINPTSITLSKTSITMEEYDDRIITATVNPSDATDKTVTWSTSDSMVAEYYNGRIYSYLPGQATITAKTSNGKTATCNVTVTPRVINPTSITLSKTSITMEEYDDRIITATVNPSDATDKTVTWSTSDSMVAEYYNGRIYSYLPGQATITAKTSNGITATCKVTVYTRGVVPDVIAMAGSTQLTLGKGEGTKLSASVSPSNATNKEINWRTSDSGILTVDSSGNVKATGCGTAWITATAAGNTKLSVSCKITVRAAPTKITLTKGVLTIGVGEKYTVGSNLDSGVACAKRTYRTSNSSVVKMTRTDWQGDFVGVKPGVAYVTVRTYNGKEATCKVTVKADPSWVKVNKSSTTISVGQTATLSAVLPDGAGAAKRTFRTSNSSIVKMNKTNWQGEFKGVKPGTAWVTVRLYNGKEASCKVTVIKPVTSVRLSSTGITLERGDTRKLTAYITPSDATQKSVTWSSSDTSVATVSGGTVTAKNPGTAKITVKSHNGKTATCTVTVKAPDRQQIYSSNGVKVYYLGAFKKSDGSLRLDLQFENKSGMESIHFSKLRDFRINNTQIKLPFGCYVSKGKTVTESIEVSSGTVSKIASSLDSSTKYKMDFEYCNAKNRSTTYSTGLKTVGKYPV